VYTEKYGVNLIDGFFFILVHWTGGTGGRRGSWRSGIWPSLMEWHLNAFQFESLIQWVVRSTSFFFRLLFKPIKCQLATSSDSSISHSFIQPSWELFPPHLNRLVPQIEFFHILSALSLFGFLSYFYTSFLFRFWHNNNNNNNWHEFSRHCLAYKQKHKKKAGVKN